MAKAIKSSGCTLSVDAVTMANVNGISHSGWSRETIDVTNLSSTSKEYLVAIPDGGELSFDLNWDAAESSHGALLTLMGSGDKAAIIVTFSNAETFSFDAYLTSCDVTIGSETDPVTASATFKVTGDVSVS